MTSSNYDVLHHDAYAYQERGINENKCCVFVLDVKKALKTKNKLLDECMFANWASNLVWSSDFFTLTLAEKIQVQSSFYSSIPTIARKL